MRNPRRLAVDALSKVEHTSCTAQDAIDLILRSNPLAPADRGLLKELVHGALRHLETIDLVLAAHSSVKLRKVHRRVLQALRVAVYQLVYLDRVPPSAAVNESVEIVKSTFPTWTVRFVNGCLRAIARSIELKVGGRLPEEDLVRAVPIRGGRNCVFEKAVFPPAAEDLAAALAARYAHPRWLVERWLDEFGTEETEDVLRAGNEPAGLWLRTTPDHHEALCRELTRRRIAHEPTAGAVRLPEPVGSPAELPGFRRGWFFVQDRTAMRAATLLAPEPGDRILDVCAAPGGKTTHLAELGGPAARVTAVDRDPDRLRRVVENLDRLGLTNVDVLAADATADAFVPDAAFDRVLADVPCSNTGVLAKRVEARRRVTPETVLELCRLQERNLRSAAARVRPGGVLVYSTCALLPEENEEVVDALLDEDDCFELTDSMTTLPVAGYRDGGFLARLVRA